MKKIVSFIISLMIFVPFAAIGEGKVSSRFDTTSGLYVIVFDVLQGKIKVNLPDDMGAGDAVSGTAIAESRGETEEERRTNTDELNKYSVEIGKERTFVVDRVIKLTLPAALSREPIYLVLRDKNGMEVNRAQIPFQIVPAIERPAIPSPENYQFPPIGQAGKPIQITGPFDGNFDTTAIKIGGRETRLIAESPRKLIVESSGEVLGPTEIELKEGNLIVRREFNNLRVVKFNQEETSISPSVGRTIKQPEKEFLAERTPAPVERMKKKAELTQAAKAKEEKILPPTPEPIKLKTKEEGTAEEESLVEPTPAPIKKAKKKMEPKAAEMNEGISTPSSAKEVKKVETIKAEQTPAPVKMVEKKIELKTIKTEEGKNPLPSPAPLPGESVKTEIKNKEAPKENAETVSPTGSGEKYTVQIGSFKKEEEAKEIVQSLVSKGYPAFVRTTEVPDKGTWYRVRIGTFNTVKEAKLYGDKLKSLEPSIGLILITPDN